MQLPQINFISPQTHAYVLTVDLAVVGNFKDSESFISFSSIPLIYIYF